nr:MAG TPA: Protein of unknown function (DUF736) [Bacteriophage sp.]
MTTIGAGWTKKDKNGDFFISTNFDEAILPLTLTFEKKLIIKVNKNKEEDNQPDYYIDIFVPQKQKTEKIQTNTGFPV